MKKPLIILVVTLLSLFSLRNAVFAQKAEEIQNIDKLYEKCLQSNEKACEKLVTAALTHADADVRYHAFKYIDNQAAFQKIALQDTDYRLRNGAAAKIEGEEANLFILDNSTEFEVREIVFKKISDLNSLAKIAKTDRSHEIRRMAFEKLRYPEGKVPIETLEDIYRNGKKLDREYVVWALGSDQPFLISIVRDPEEYVKHKENAVALIKDLDFLAALALDGKESATIRSRALSNLFLRHYADTTIYAQLALNDQNDNSLRKDALGFINDKTTLMLLAGNGMDADIREAAESRMLSKGYPVPRIEEEKKQLALQEKRKTAASHAATKSEPAEKPTQKKTDTKTDGPAIGTTYKHSTRFGYDDTGRLTGAFTTLEISITGEEGEVYTCDWRASSGMINGNNSSAEWTRIISMGQPEVGIVTVTITGSKGNKLEKSFIFR